jgi:hypothetical protein
MQISPAASCHTETFETKIVFPKYIARSSVCFFSAESVAEVDCTAIGMFWLQFQAFASVEWLIFAFFEYRPYAGLVMRHTCFVLAFSNLEWIHKTGSFEGCILSVFT